MSWYVAPSLLKLRAETDAKWPKRSKDSDGSIGDASHMEGASPGAKAPNEHVPSLANGVYDKDGCVRAIDIDKDGIDPEWLLTALIADGKKNRRLHYVIWNGYIYSRTNNWAKKVYNGADKHRGHLHISVANRISTSQFSTAEVTAAEKDTSPWFPAAPKPAPKKVNKYVVNADVLNVRSSGSTATSKNIVGQAERGQKVSGYEVETGGRVWVVDSKGSHFARQYLLPYVTYKVDTAVLNVRNAPNGKKVGEVKRNTYVLVTSITSGWAKDVDGDYYSAEYLKRA